MSDTTSEEQNAELLPCPFCGASPLLDTRDNVVGVRCDNPECAVSVATITHGNTIAAAGAAWNRRIEAPGQSPERERAHACVDAVIDKWDGEGFSGRASDLTDAIHAAADAQRKSGEHRG